MATMLYLRFVVDILSILGYSVWLLVVKLFRVIVPRQQKSLKDEIILVTGGANGIGREICRELVMKEPDVTVIIWDIDQENIELVLKELRGLSVKDAFGFKVDISDRHQVKSSAELIRKEIGEVTMVFNNAGISGELKAGWSIRPERIEKVLDVNMTSHCWSILEFLPSMINMGKGHVVETCSVLGYGYMRGGSAYVASKHGLKAYAECIKEDLRHLPHQPKIYFSLIYPHFTSTNMMDKINIKSRKYPFLIPQYTANDVAKRAVDGVLRNEEHIYFPSFYSWGPMCMGMWPSEIFRRVMDMVDLQYEES